MRTTTITAGLVAFLLVACGGSSDESSIDATPPATSPATTDEISSTVAPTTDVPDDDGSASSDPVTTDAPEASDEPVAESVPASTEPAVDTGLGALASIEGLSAPFTAFGDRPVFAWDAVDGAASYDVWALNADGTIYWAWSGSETTIPLGGVPLLPPEAEGPDVSADMSWTVSAYDADGTLIAVGSAELEPG